MKPSVAAASHPDCSLCDTKCGRKSSRTRHLKKFHADYYAANCSQGESVHSGFQEARRRINVAASQQKYYRGNVKIRKEEEKSFLKYSKAAMTTMMADKAAKYFDGLMKKYFLNPSCLIPDLTTSQGKAALQRKYEQELEDRQVQIRFLKTKVEIELPKVLASVNDNDLKLKIRDLAEKYEEK